MKNRIGVALLTVTYLSLQPLYAGGPSPARTAFKEDKAGRDAWLWKKDAGPSNRIPAEALRRSADARERCLLAEAAASESAWEPIGPAPIRGGTMIGGGPTTYAGRALAIAQDPLDPSTLLLGAASGGIWRSTNTGTTWASVGDNLPSLAIKVIRFAPSAPSIVYAGSGEPHSKTSIWGMGVFKSTDGGITWTALPVSGPTWDFRFLAISGLQVHPQDPNTLWATTANVLPDRVDAFHPPPDAAAPGIFKSTDGGHTWRRLLTALDYRPYDYPAFDPYPASGIGFMDLELFRADPRVLYAVERSGGIYRTTDGGEHWALCTPLKNPGHGAASGPDFPAPVPAFGQYAASTGTFTPYPVLKRAMSIPEFNRIELGIGQAGGTISSDWRTEVLYAGAGAILQLDADGDGIFDPNVDLTVPTALIFKSADGGQTWRWLGDGYSGGAPYYCDVDASGYENALYDNTVEVNPIDPDDVVVGGNANYAPLWPDPVRHPTRLLELPWSGTIYRTQDGGATWVDTTPACVRYVPDTGNPPVDGLPLYACAEQSPEKMTHPDTHCCIFDPANGRFFITDDGGAFECTLTGNGADPLNDYHWRDINGDTATLQVFLFGTHPTDASQALVGCQDNSNAHWDGSAWDAWDSNGGDGTVACYDPKSPEHVYIGCQYTLARSDHGGSNDPDDWTYLFSGTIGHGDGFPFVVIFAIDPVQSNRVYVGSLTGVYASGDRGDTWSDRLNANPLDGEVTTLAVSPKNPRFVWAGTSTGHVYLFDTKKGEVTDRTGNFLPNRWVSAVVPSAKSPDKVLIAFSGYDANSSDWQSGGNGNVGRVFKTSDRGATWKDVSGNLTGENGLDIPASALAQDPKNPDRLWIGTDYGIFASADGGKSWRSARGDMPAVAVTGLEFNKKTGYLTAATFGRGLWRMKVK
jgi:WD40 repeat protein